MIASAHTASSHGFWFLLINSCFTVTPAPVASERHGHHLLMPVPFSTRLFETDAVRATGACVIGVLSGP